MAYITIQIFSFIKVLSLWELELNAGFSLQLTEYD